MTTTVRTKKDVVTEFRTTGILEAARKVFAKKGFSNATVDDIASAAGVAKGTIYLYYESKRDIYFAALKFGIEQMYSVLEEQLMVSWCPKGLAIPANSTKGLLEDAIPDPITPWSELRVNVVAYCESL